MNNELQRTAAAAGVLCLLAFGVILLARQLSGREEAQKPSNGSAQLRIDRAQLEVTIAQQREVMAEQQVSSAELRTQQTAIAVKDTLIKIDQQIQNLQFADAKVARNDYVYRGSRDFADQIAGPMGAMNVTVRAPDIAPVIIAQEDALKQGLTTRQAITLLDNEYSTNVNEFKRASNDLENARRAVKTAQQEVEQKQKTLDILLAGSLATPSHP